MTTLVIDLGDIPLSDKSQVILLAELKRAALAHLERLGPDEPPGVLPRGMLWRLMLHGASHGYWSVDDDPRVR